MGEAAVSVLAAALISIEFNSYKSPEMKTASSSKAYLSRYANSSRIKRWAKSDRFEISRQHRVV